MKPKKNTDFIRHIITYGISLSMIFVAVVLLYNAVNSFLSAQKLKNELETVRLKLEELQKENVFLTDQKHKLQDPEYVIKYARGQYMLSKEGEKIFYLPLNPQP